MEFHTSLFHILFVKSFQSHNHVVRFLKADRPGFYFSCITHPNGDGGYQFTSLCTLFHHEAHSDSPLSAIECNTMTRFCEKDSGTSWIGEVKSVKDKVSTIRLLFWRRKVSRASLHLNPYLKGITMHSSSGGRRRFLLDLLYSTFRFQLSLLKDFLLLSCLLSGGGR